jgi:hypothetical protein
VTPPAEHPVVKTIESALTVGTPGVKPPSASAPVDPRHVVDVLLDAFRPHFGAHFLETTSGVFRACGFYGLYVACAVTAIFALLAALKITALGGLLGGAVLILGLIVLQYVSDKSCDALDEINRTVPGRLSSALLPNCLAAISKVVAVGSLLGSVAVGVESSQYAAILGGLGSFLVFTYLAVVAMNPASMNVAIAPEGVPGEEAAGAVTFLAKSLLRTVPVAFGVGVIAGTLMMATACFGALSEEPAGSRIVAFSAAQALSISAVLPLAAYLLFLLVNLIVNIWRSVLSLPTKLDKIATEGVEEEKKA